MAQTPQEADAEWSAALIARDTEGVLPYMDDDYTLVVLTPALARVARPEWLALLPQYVISGWITEFSEWDVAGDLAIHTQLVHQTALVMGGDRSGPVTITDVWRRSAGQWKVWRRVSTPLAFGDMPRMA